MWFSAIDVVQAINDEPNYVKAGNYWRWLKKKLAAQNIEVVSGTHEFKFLAPDGKMRKADTIDGKIRTKNISKGGFTEKYLDFFANAVKNA